MIAVITGKESKQDVLSKHINWTLSPGLDHCWHTINVQKPDLIRKWKKNKKKKKKNLPTILHEHYNMTSKATERKVYNEIRMSVN